MNSIIGYKNEEKMTISPYSVCVCLVIRRIYFNANNNFFFPFSYYRDVFPVG